MAVIMAIITMAYIIKLAIILFKIGLNITFLFLLIANKICLNSIKAGIFIYSALIRFNYLEKG